MVGYGRLEGLGAATILARLHEVVRLYVNYFQPCFKLKSKVREGAKVIKKYHAPATPAERLLASDRVSADGKQHLRDVFSSLDPVELLRRIGVAVGGSRSLYFRGDGKERFSVRKGIRLWTAATSIQGLGWNPDRALSAGLNDRTEAGSAI
jgi:hypothetical protein